MPLKVDDLRVYPQLYRIVSTVIAVWPEHADYCEARFADDTPDVLQRSDELAGLVLKLTDDGAELAEYCSDYAWMCAEFLKEELYFRRHDKYRITTFQDAQARVYDNADFMRRYVRGILISQLIWLPHARSFDYFRTEFLPKVPPNSRHLEVGPGHGLFLYFTSKCPAIAELEAWDVSKSSIKETQKALAKLGVTRPIKLTEQDVLAAAAKPEGYDSAIISEVLEHLERPDLALATLRTSLRPGGRLYINIPINSPAPDHIYLWKHPDECVEWIKAQGFEIEAKAYFPLTGVTLDRAIRRKLHVSCIVIARRPAA